MVNREKSFFSFEKQGIRKSLKGEKTDSYQGPKLSHISITPKSAVTIQPPKKVGLFLPSNCFGYHYSLAPLRRVARNVVRSSSCAVRAVKQSHLPLNRA